MFSFFSGAEEEMVFFMGFPPSPDRRGATATISKISRKIFLIVSPGTVSCSSCVPHHISWAARIINFSL
jgi:hypothetical protein